MARQPVQLRIRGGDAVRDKFTSVHGKHDLGTYSDTLIEMCEFVLEHESEFERHITQRSRSGDGSPNKEERSI